MSGLGDRVRSFCNFVWNSDEKTFLGRGGRSWAEIGVFYLIYYSCLAGFFVGMLAVFYQTVDEKRPKLTGDSSLLKGNPGMGFQPMPDVEYTLVRFRVQPKTYEPHVKSIQKILKPYIESQAKPEDERKGVDCAGGVMPKEGESCRVDVAALTQECNIQNNFGFGKETQPCILLRLNKIFDWMPQKFTAENVNSSGASVGLRNRMVNEPDMIYIECVGENPADRDNIGNITYYPEQGFRHYYYPFTNQPDYMSPLVFVKFLNPPKNIALMVECRALAPNIRYDRTEKEGGVHFELLVDP
ncbi:sodium/potassium-transporting ATPase subunit beta-like [Babylonia areolata]|uniref:sodium/potassium-transporting ATPase subunit beta-like n=1 Tax=Babylonia areolata TaxID=304850 RepID=UPI003FD3DDFA